MTNVDLVELRKYAESGEFTPYSVKTFALDGARTDELVECEGDFVHAWLDGVLVDISIRFNMKTNDAINLARHNPIYGLKFWRLYLTHTAQPGQTFELLIAQEGVRVNV